MAPLFSSAFPHPQFLLFVKPLYLTSLHFIMSWTEKILHSNLTSQWTTKKRIIFCFYLVLLKYHWGLLIVFSSCPSICVIRASLVAQLVKNPPAMQETPSLIPGSGRSAREGIGYPLQYSWASLLVGKIPWRREKLPTPVFWPGEFHGL